MAVFRRGSTNWSHVGQWDLARLRYEPGAWLRGRIFPRRCDLSPDGQCLSYFAHKPSATWERGGAYMAVSKLPWLTALHAFATCGTWTRGYFFTKDASAHACEVPDLAYRLQSIPALQFATERRRGWEEAPDCHPRDRETCGTNIETPACRSGNQAVIDFFVSRVLDMQGVNSGRNRRSTACECNIPSKQTTN